MDKSEVKVTKVDASTSSCSRCGRIFDGSVGYRTFNDKEGAPMHHVCLPCQEGEQVVHLHCSCPPPTDGEVSSHRPGCHVPAELERRDQEYLSRAKTARSDS